MPARIVVLGGGVGGTLVANLLDKQLGREAVVTVVDPTGMHHYQPGYLYVALGQANGRWLTRDVRTLLRRGVRLEVEEVTRIHAERQEVHFARGGNLPYDYLVIATGARLVPETIEGAVGATHEFYSLEGSQRLREAVRTFRGGKVLVGIAGIPYKCPPAPIEFTFMFEDLMRQRKLRDRTEISYLSPLNRCFTIESASKLLQPLLDARGIALSTFFNVDEIDASNHIAKSIEGEEAEFDLMVLIPPHRGQKVIMDSGLGDAGGWIPVDRNTLAVHDQHHIWAIGDATDLPISKSGSTAHFEAPVVASRIASLVRGTAPKESYGGRVMCFVETGRGQATALRFDYDNPPEPPKPNRFWHYAKWMFNRLYWETIPQGRLPEMKDGGKGS
jgi:sulfide:quinone oxidoreductase